MDRSYPLPLPMGFHAQCMGAIIGMMVVYEKIDWPSIRYHICRLILPSGRLQNNEARSSNGSDNFIFGADETLPEAKRWSAGTPSLVDGIRMETATASRANSGRL